MPIQISCPSCQRQLRVPDNLIGQMVKCPSCQNTFTAMVEESGPPSEEGARAQPKPSAAPQEEEYREAKPSRRDDDDRDRDEPRRSRRRDRDRDDDYDDGPRRRRRDYVPHRGTTILLLGILAFVGFGMLTGIPAWIMGNNDLAQMRAGVMDPEGESNTNVGRILGMVSTILGLIGCGCGCLWMIVVMGAKAGHR